MQRYDCGNRTSLASVPAYIAFSNRLQNICVLRCCHVACLRDARRLTASESQTISAKEEEGKLICTFLCVELQFVNSHDTNIRERQRIKIVFITVRFRIVFPVYCLKHEDYDMENCNITCFVRVSGLRTGHC
jgi:hypothetical protein